MWWARVILVAALALPIFTSAASGVLPYQIFWKNPRAPEAILCAQMVIRPPTAEDPSDIPFCRAFRQFQVIEVRGAWARIGSDVWIRTAVLTNLAFLQPSDARSIRWDRRKDAWSLQPSSQGRHRWRYSQPSWPQRGAHRSDSAGSVTGSQITDIPRR